MTYSYQKDRESFFFAIGRIGGTESAARALLRAATTIQRTAEIDCSFEQSESEAARNERRSDAAVERAAKAAATFGATIRAEGDPRGYTLVVIYDRPDRNGCELGVPGRGLPARCFA